MFSFVLAVVGLSVSPSSAMRDPIVSALSKAGFGRVRHAEQLTTSGSSSAHWRYDTDEGRVFCKRSAADVSAFEGEAASLRALRAASLSAGLLRVAEPLALGSLPLGGSFLLLEWVEHAPPGASVPTRAYEALGAGVAALHTAPQPPPRRGFGFERDTHLGATRQDNGWEAGLADFFVQRRLARQLSVAQARLDDLPRSAGAESGRALRQMAEPALEAAHALLDLVADPPALLHGHLCAHNAGLEASSLAPILHGPASWYGHPEYDLSLPAVRLGDTEGGGLPAAFYDSYFGARPKRAGFDERADIFELYHRLRMLNEEADAAAAGGAAAGGERVDAVCARAWPRVRELMERACALRP